MGLTSFLSFVRQYYGDALINVAGDATETFDVVFVDVNNVYSKMTLTQGLAELEKVVARVRVRRRLYLMIDGRREVSDAPSEYGDALGRHARYVAARTLLEPNPPEVFVVDHGVMGTADEKITCALHYEDRQAKGTEEEVSYALVSTDSDLLLSGLCSPLARKLHVLATHGIVDAGWFYVSVGAFARNVHQQVVAGTSTKKKRKHALALMRGGDEAMSLLGFRTRFDFALLSLLFLGSDGFPGLLFGRRNAGHPGLFVPLWAHYTQLKQLCMDRYLLVIDDSTDVPGIQYDVALLAEICGVKGKADDTTGSHDHDTKESALLFLSCVLHQCHGYMFGVTTEPRVVYPHQRTPSLKTLLELAQEGGDSNSVASLRWPPVGSSATLIPYSASRYSRSNQSGKKSGRAWIAPEPPTKGSPRVELKGTVQETRGVVEPADVVDWSALVDAWRTDLSEPIQVASSKVFSFGGDTAATGVRRTVAPREATTNKLLQGLASRFGAVGSSGPTTNISSSEEDEIQGRTEGLRTKRNLKRKRARERREDMQAQQQQQQQEMKRPRWH